jgi:hypothetical protein
MTSRRPAPAAVRHNYVDGVGEVSGSKPCCHPIHHAVAATQRLPTVAVGLVAADGLSSVGGGSGSVGGGMQGADRPCPLQPGKPGSPIPALEA